MNAIRRVLGWLGRTTSPSPLKSASSRGPALSIYASKEGPVSHYSLDVLRGWGKKGDTYTGYYRTGFGAYKGQIIRRADSFKVYIFKPPIAKIDKHPKGPCFERREGAKYQIHLTQNPKDRDIASIIFYVESLIIESYLLSEQG